MISHGDGGPHLADECREVVIVEVTEPCQIAEIARNAATGWLGQCSLGDVEAVMPAGLCRGSGGVPRVRLAVAALQHEPLREGCLCQPGEEALQDVQLDVPGISGMFRE